MPRAFHNPTKPRSKRPNGVIIYQGPSLLDGSPIVVILTGLNAGSANRKTGKMLQTWILRTDVDPIAAVASGADAGICGDCPHRRRRHVDGRFRRTCYVNVGQGPLAVYGAFHRGNYPHIDSPEGRAAIERAIARGVTEALRVGSYGDPTAAPFAAWEHAVGLISPQVRTGYTHQWRNPEFAPFAALCMASCDSPQDVEHANAAGWRAFHVRPKGAPAPAGQVRCPSDPTGRVHVPCTSCGQCSGSGGRRTRSVWITAHGPSARFVALPTA